MGMRNDRVMREAPQACVRDANSSPAPWRRRCHRLLRRFDVSSRGASAAAANLARAVPASSRAPRREPTTVSSAESPQLFLMKADSAECGYPGDSGTVTADVIIGGGEEAAFENDGSALDGPPPKPPPSPTPPAPNALMSIAPELIMSSVVIFLRCCCCATAVDGVSRLASEEEGEEEGEDEEVATTAAHRSARPVASPQPPAEHGHPLPPPQRLPLSPQLRRHVSSAFRPAMKLHKPRKPPKKKPPPVESRAGGRYRRNGETD